MFLKITWEIVVKNQKGEETKSKTFGKGFRVSVVFLFFFGTEIHLGVGDSKGRCWPLFEIPFDLFFNFFSNRIVKAVKIKWGYHSHNAPPPGSFIFKLQLHLKIFKIYCIYTSI